MALRTFILTHPLTGNYGGLLQAYASYTTLNDLGCEPDIYRYIPKDIPAKSFSHAKYFVSIAKHLGSVSDLQVVRTCRFVFSLESHEVNLA